jgi:ATP-binding cassette subfamily F protein 3
MAQSDMLTISDVTKAFGGRTLFENATVQVDRGDRIGLVGVNGAGKSTLFSLILRAQAPDEGKILMDRRAHIGWLPQESEPAADETVLQLAVGLGNSIAGTEYDGPETSEDEGLAIHEELAEAELEPKAKKILRGLGFREKDFDRPARELSGGWVMRARLANLLVREPDLLLLDEPTNHLDLEALLWFQGYLKNYPGAILLISHDREFLNEIVGTIVEIHQGRLMRYQGNYDSYLEQRQARLEQQEAAYKNQQREIGRLMDFVNRFRAKNTKAAQAQSKLKQIERMEKIAAPEAGERELEFRFPQPERSGLKAIKLEHVAFAYGASTVYTDLNFVAERGQRIVLVGPNGAGKSTLLKLLAGVLPVQSGLWEPGFRVKTGYYSQYRIEMLHADRTVLDEALDTPKGVTETFVRTVLGSFGFCGDDVFKEVKVLSGGEKSRLALVRFLLDPPNLLLMDEPTTHLDMDGVEALIYALQKFEGTLIFISHDVFFIRELSDHVVHVKNGVLRHFTGGYGYYQDRMAAEAAAAEQAIAAQQNVRKPVAETSAVPAREQRRLLAQQQDARAKLRRDQRKHVQALEKEIHQIEHRQVELTAELEDPATYEKKDGRAAAVNRELSDITDRIPELMKDWEAAAEKLQALEAD